VAAAAVSIGAGQVSCSSVGFRAPPPAPPPYDGSGSATVFHQLARCGLARPGAPPGAIVTGKHRTQRFRDYYVFCMLVFYCAALVA